MSVSLARAEQRHAVCSGMAELKVGRGRRRRGEDDGGTKIPDLEPRRPPRTTCRGTSRWASGRSFPGLPLPGGNAMLRAEGEMDTASDDVKLSILRPGCSPCSAR
jgi:hypothetical protein